MKAAADLERESYETQVEKVDSYFTLHVTSIPKSQFHLDKLYMTGHPALCICRALKQNHESVSPKLTINYTTFHTQYPLKEAQGKGYAVICLEPKRYYHFLHIYLKLES